MRFSVTDDARRLGSYAIVNAAKSEPFPHGRGFCPACGGGVIAKCGRIKSHHWAYEAREDCDPWAEHLGAWQLSSQNVERPGFVEVPIPPHRADIVGVNGTVIELQHSPLGLDKVQRREKFYGTMVWVFVCTHRIDAVRSGDRCCFSFGKTQQIHACRRPVFLDFGKYLVEVVRLDNPFYGFSGYGIVRDRSWFLGTFRCERTRSDSRVMTVGRTAAPLDLPRSPKAKVTR